MDHLQNVMGYFDQQQPLCAEHDRISKDLYKEFGVKAGLRDENGKGVLAGLKMCIRDSGGVGLDPLVELGSKVDGPQQEHDPDGVVNGVHHQCEMCIRDS